MLFELIWLFLFYYLHCQKKTVEVIINGNGHYVLAIRGHLSIENQLHYPLDAFFFKDANNNFSILRKMVNSLLVLIAPMFRNGYKMRTLKSFRINYEKNFIRLFVFLEELNLNILFNSNNKQ